MNDAGELSDFGVAVDVLGFVAQQELNVVFIADLTAGRIASRMDLHNAVYDIFKLRAHYLLKKRLVLVLTREQLIEVIDVRRDVIFREFNPDWSAEIPDQIHRVAVQKFRAKRNVEDIKLAVGVVIVDVEAVYSVRQIDEAGAAREGQLLTVDMIDPATAAADFNLIKIVHMQVIFAVYAVLDKVWPSRVLGQFFEEILRNDNHRLYNLLKLLYLILRHMSISKKLSFIFTRFSFNLTLYL